MEVNNSGDSLNRAMLTCVNLLMCCQIYLFSSGDESLKTDELSAACKKELLDIPSVAKLSHRK